MSTGTNEKTATSRGQLFYLCFYLKPVIVAFNIHLGNFESFGEMDVLFFFQPLYFPFYILALISAPMTLLVQQNDPTIGFANGDKSICFAV